MIRLENVSFGYGRECLIHELSFSLPDSAITGILGPNGSGKSTSLKLCAGLISPKSGRVLLDNTGLHTLSPRSAARRIAYLPQSRPLPALTVRALVMNGRYPHIGIARKPVCEDISAVEEALEMTGMQDMQRRELRTLSGGELQKAYIAMLIAQGAKHMLLDEPTTYLDIGRQLELMELLQKLRDSGRCIAIVMHDIGMAERICDGVIVMQHGGVIYNGSARELVESGAIENAYGVRPVHGGGIGFERM